jgi:hypothetical protein
MRYQITEATARPDHTVTITWSDGISATVSLAPYLDKGGLFEALKDPDYFMREMRVMPGGIGLAWPNDVDFSADGLRPEPKAEALTGDPTERFNAMMEIAKRAGQLPVLDSRTPDEIIYSMTDDDLPTPRLFGEDWMAALLLQMVNEHCTGHSPEKARLLDNGQATYLSPDPSPGEWLDSYESPANADAMRELAGQGLIEIVQEGGDYVLAKVTAEGRALLDRLAHQRTSP